MNEMETSEYVEGFDTARYKYGLFFFIGDDLFHIIGYETEPTHADIKSAVFELVDDPDFGYGEEMMRKSEVITAFITDDLKLKMHTMGIKLI